MLKDWNFLDPASNAKGLMTPDARIIVRDFEASIVQGIRLLQQIILD